MVQKKTAKRSQTKSKLLKSTLEMSTKVSTVTKPNKVVVKERVSEKSTSTGRKIKLL